MGDEFGPDEPTGTAPTDMAAQRPDLEGALRSVLNSYSAENASDTPDFILAEYVKGCLDAFNQAVRVREKWYGRRDFA